MTDPSSLRGPPPRGPPPGLASAGYPQSRGPPLGFAPPRGPPPGAPPGRGPPPDVLRDSGRHRSHREESVAGGDDRVDRRPVTCDALRALKDEVLRDRSSAERHAKAAYRCADAIDDL
ncbi:uncharacterized protein PHALS_00788 [Plasmopara halstedii]|uniref:Uncharacterized protein n=1 Tax=Plasmopara halstedii TaxID=4781 RepID=A0A0P1ATX9_PLAHL|nr:uncharacterized protein PHALS_00788 [Plasmopara halstedii]CEG44420.1 hypothetical protein PHALS_00788 [Plasmopara halstedii]|eukprot:XP_024580789.1 hypothetical protein PHALS_00788 [Plasmopara halstedii]